MKVKLSSESSATLSQSESSGNKAYLKCLLTQLSCQIISYKSTEMSTSASRISSLVPTLHYCCSTSQQGEKE